MPHVVTLKEIMDFFREPGETIKEFRDQWVRLSEKDKEEIKSGLADGSLNY
jgi:hypothetical protein